MKNEIKKSFKGLCALPLAALLFASVAQADPTHANDITSMSHENMQKDAAESGSMKESMKDGMNEMHNMQMTGDVDKDFAMMMKMHHQKGLEMAKMELANGKSPTMKAMAKKIITAQKKEIAQFDQWLAKQK